MYKKDFEHFNQIFFLTNKKKMKKKTKFGPVILWDEIKDVIMCTKIPNDINLHTLE